MDPLELVYVVCARDGQFEAGLWASITGAPKCDEIGLTLARHHCDI